MFGTSRSSEKIIAVADIGSGSAGVAIVMTKGKEPVRVIAAHRITLSFEDRTEDATLKGVLANLEQAAQTALATYATGEHKKKRISTVYAIIRAPWTISKTIQKTSLFEAETHIGNSVISKLAQQAIAEDTTIQRDNLIESAVVRVELNGYPTLTPVGKTAHKLSVSILVSECFADMKAGVEDALGRAFPGIRPTFRSGARTLLSVLRALPTSTDDYVVFDMQDEASDILTVRAGLASEQVSIPEGLHSILKRIFEKGLPEESLSLIRMIERGDCATDACEAVSAAMGKTEIELSKIFGDSLMKIAVPLRLPPDFVLITHPDLSPWLSRFFSRIDFTQCTVTAQPFSVHALVSENLASFSMNEAPAAADLELLVATSLVNIEENA